MPKQASVVEDIMDELRAFLKRAPWWAGLVAIGVGYVTFYAVIPVVLGFLSTETDAERPLNFPEMLGNVCRVGAPFVALAITGVWLIALFDKFTDKQRLERQSGIDSIRELSWRALEQLLATAFERQGYTVTDTGLTHGPGSPDGGVDLILEKNSKRYLVQCKQWKARKVGVKIARELYGLVASEHADGGILVTSGHYTQDARKFAENLSLNLIDGPKLEKLIHSVQSPAKPKPRLTRPAETAQPGSAATPSAPACPKCQSPMIHRTAKRGAKAGQSFWGCPSFPNCRGTRSM